MQPLHHTYALIMAGGSGTRFWPWSRIDRPKQFLPIMGKRSLIQDTASRLEGIIPPERLFVVTDTRYRDMVKEHLPALPDENILLEPFGKNTAPCIALGAVHIQRRDPEAVMIAMAADHAIQDVERYRRILTFASNYAHEHEELVTLGIPPAYPETGYGYYRRGTEVGRDGDVGLYRVREIIEKPDLSTCRQYLESGEYFWHGMHSAWQVKTILSQFERHLPEVYGPMRTIGEAIGTPKEQETLERCYSSLPSISIDYGIMERSAEETVIIPAAIGWSDVGSWAALAELHAQSPAFKDGKNPVIGFESPNCLVLAESGKLVATLGVENLVIVETPNALLVADLKRSQEVRKIVALIKEKGLEGYL